MRVAIVSPYTLPFHSGNSLLADRLRTELGSRGHQAAVFNSTVDSHQAAIDFAPNILHGLHAVRTAAWTEKMLSEYHIPFIITLTGTDYNGRVSGSRSSTLLKRSLLRASGLVVFHDEAYGMLKNTHPSVTEKVSVIPQGVALFQDRVDRSSVRAEFSLKENDIIFMTVTGIRPVKNIGYALDAFAEIKKQVSNATLLLVGPVIDKEEARRVLERGERQPDFIYLGDQPHIVVQSLMSAADIYLNTSLNEGMSGAMLEAMASGLPVLATRVPGNRSLIRNNHNGLLVDPDSPGKLVHAALKLASDKTLRKRLGHMGRQLASDHHSIEEEIGRYENLYETILLSPSS